MGFRFRKSISLGKGIRLNVGKKGLGISAGVKGFRVGVGSRGAYTSSSIPGTGISWVNYAKGNKTNNIPSNNPSQASQGFSPGCLLVIIAVLLIAFLHVIGIVLVIIGAVIYYFWANQPEQKAKRLLTKAKKIFSNQNWGQTITLLQEANKLDPKNIEVIHLLGGCFYNFEKFEDAAKYLEEYNKIEQFNYNAQLVLATCFYRLEKYQEAIDILQTFPSEESENLKVIEVMGMCFAGEKKYDIAINVFKKAPLLKRNLDDDLIELHYNLALVYEESGDKKNAIKHFKKVYAVDTDYKDVSEKLQKLENLNN